MSQFFVSGILIKLLEKIDGEKVEIVTDFIFLGSKITIHSDRSHEIERQLLPGRRAMANLDSVSKSRELIPMY